MTWFTEFVASEQFMQFVHAGILLVVGFLLASIVSRFVFKMLSSRFNTHHSTLFRRLTYWIVLLLFLTSALQQLGFSIGVLLGAAGVLSVAIGFASQTSASNLISGLFLVGEKPFELGDIITIGNTTGEVLSVDLLSVKLRTFDNLFVRIPNETLIKTEMINLTRFPIRRFDLKVGVAYRENIAKVREVLMAVAEKDPLCLDEPAPLFLFLGFGDSSLDIQFSVWAKRENFRDLRNTMQEAVKNAFDEAGIEIPFPHRSLYTGSVTDPFPIRIVTENGAATALAEPPHGESKTED
ncbi:mechanosensitive ion channel family protein [Marinimicrobium alkaliphilum]|uniref:mechanosensitive ion channel family protein n=1 Tax=Marinimicrobium alkaliphilum TaxID=2202654 RepID=UPI000DB9CA32|nr:mechanosensitive ion channel family protein [Marinimicrobium alkaliphilum]